MKKIGHIDKLNRDTSFNEKEIENKIKTTNVNILLNRVRLNQKKDFKKKLIFISIFVAIVSSLIAFIVI